MKKKKVRTSQNIFNTCVSFSNPVDVVFGFAGGDAPEAVADALNEVSRLSWRPASTKICVFIADAPPHGLGGSGDGFPNGYHVY